MNVRVIQVRPSRNPRCQKQGGWEVFEGPGVSPTYCGDGARESALSYARQRAGYGRVEIQVLDESGNVSVVLRTSWRLIFVGRAANEQQGGYHGKRAQRAERFSIPSVGQRRTVSETLSRGSMTPATFRPFRLINQCTFSRVARNVPLSSLKNFPFWSKFFMSKVPV